MKTRTGSIPITTIALVVVAVALASSTVYFAYQAGAANSAATRSGANSNTPSRPLGEGTDAAPSSGVQTGDAPSDADSITVSSAGEVTYVPNEALVDVSVVTQNSTAEGATASNAAITISVVKALNGIGVSNSSIETQGYSLSADYASCYNSCVPQITGYTVTNSLQVNLTSSNGGQLGLQAGRVIDAAVAAGANQISLSFSETNSGIANLTNEAIQQAVASAYSQAQALASSTAVTITGVLNVSEGTSYSPYLGSSLTFSANVSSTPSTPIIPGAQSMSVSVQVVYAIS